LAKSRISFRDLHCSELFKLVCTDRVEPSLRSVTALSVAGAIAEGAVTRLTGFHPVRLPHGVAGLPSFFARAFVILFRGVACAYAALLRPSQFTKRRILTFITIPSARNMNRTEDPP
jgi:hypothetical protein